MKKFLSDWIFQLIAYVIFMTLFAALLSGMSSLPMSQLIAGASSNIAYSMMLVGLFIASRPRFLEKHVGMPKMYEIHALMTYLAVILVGIHIAVYWQGFGAIFRSATTTYGYIAFAGMLGGLLTGSLSLSGMFINKNKTLRTWKEKVFNREAALWIHRISALVAILGTYMQNYELPFLRANKLYMAVLTFWTVLIVGYYAWWKLSTTLLPKYVVKDIYLATPSLWVLEFEPKNGKLKDYTPGDYFFIRFKGGANITKEAHPFSTSSAITKLHDSSIEFMIKEAGDWTSALKNIKVGDVATLEGPYGNFYPQEVREADKPYVLFGGGIGLTPVLSILRSEADKGSQRKIHLVWALSWEHDMFMLDELDGYKAKFPNFTYDVIFSNEEVEGYPYGFISGPFLQEIGVSEIYQEATFFICGPDVMMNASKNVLLNEGVPAENIYVDEFGF